MVDGLQLPDDSGEDLPAIKDVQAVSELGFPAGGQPDELVAEGAADDGGLLGFNQADEGVGVPGQKVLSEEALGDVPALRQEAFLLKSGVDPVDGDAGVFDSVASLRVVLDDLAGADAPLEVYLVEDDGPFPGAPPGSSGPRASSSTS